MFPHLYILKSFLSAFSTLKKFKSVNLSKRILSASKVRYPQRSRLRLVWLHLPCVPGLPCRWRPQLPLRRPPALHLPPTPRPTNHHSPGRRLHLGPLQLLAAPLLVPPLLGRILPLRLMAVALRQRCSDPNLQMSKRNAFINTNVGSLHSPLLI